MAIEPSPPEAVTTAAVDFTAYQQNPQFQELRKRHRSFVFPMAIFFLLWYFLYVLLASYATDFMSTPVWGNINIGLIFGLLQFVTTFVITFVYARWANRELDPLATKLGRRYEKETGR